MSKVLTRADVLAAPSVGCELIEVPEWGGAVWVRGLTVRQRNAYVDSIHEPGPGGAPRRVADWMERLVAMCVVASDTDPTPMFTPGELADKPPVVLDRLFKAASRLSGFDLEPEQAAKN